MDFFDDDGIGEDFSDEYVSDAESGYDDRVSDSGSDVDSPDIDSILQRFNAGSSNVQDYNGTTPEQSYPATNTVPQPYGGSIGTARVSIQQPYSSSTTIPTRVPIQPVQQPYGGVATRVPIQPVQQPYVTQPVQPYGGVTPRVPIQPVQQPYVTQPVQQPYGASIGVTPRVPIQPYVSQQVQQPVTTRVPIQPYVSQQQYGYSPSVPTYGTIPMQVQQTYAPQAEQVQPIGYILIDIFSPIGLKRREGAKVQEYEEGASLMSYPEEDVSLFVVPKKKKLSYERELDEEFKLKNGNITLDTLDRLSKCYVNSIMTGCKYPLEIQAFV